MKGVLADSRVVLFYGGFGSGKTETALSYAVAAARAGHRVRVVDLDMVTPAFRSREAAGDLQREGVEVLSTGEEYAATDLSVWPPQVRRTLEEREGVCVLDTGGDPQGARILGAIREELKRTGYEAFYVVNPRRPFTRTAGAIVEQVRAVEDAARLKCTGLVSNPHLGRRTTLEVIVEGHRVVGRAARALDLEVAFACVAEPLVRRVGAELDGSPVLPLALYMRPPWERAT